MAESRFSVGFAPSPKRRPDAPADLTKEAPHVWKLG
jgi:hypothetical protein